jgi:hypothetical protein
MGFIAGRLGAACMLLLGVVAFDAGAASMAASAASAPATAASAGSAAAASRLEDYQLLALSSSERVAVLRGPDHRLVTLRVGMSLPVEHAVLKEVAGGKLRFDILGPERDHQTAWMSRGATPRDPVAVQRVAGKGPAQPATAKRVIARVALPSGAASAAK